MSETGKHDLLVPKNAGEQAHDEQPLSSAPVKDIEQHPLDTSPPSNNV